MDGNGHQRSITYDTTFQTYPVPRDHSGGRWEAGSFHYGRLQPGLGDYYDQHGL